MTVEIKPRRLSGLEVSRGLAALAVVVFHLMVIYLPLPLGVTQQVISSFGGAVPFFFALSAFSLCFGYSRLIISERGMERFYIRRIFRILPLFYFMLSIYCAKAYFSNQWISPADIIINASFLFPFFPGKHESLVWAGWSLGVEWLFYMIFPLVALLSRKFLLSMIVFLFLCLAALAIHRMTPSLDLDHAYFSMNMPSNLVYFQAGVLAYAMVQLAHQSLRANLLFTKLHHFFYPLFFSTVILLLSYRFGLPETVRAKTSAAPLLACVCAVWVMLAYAGLPKLIDNRVTRYVGKLSYGIYLVHPLVLWASAQLGVFEYVSNRVESPFLALFICASMVAPLVIFVADIAYRMIENPAIAVGEKILRRSPGTALPAVGEAKPI